MAQQGTFTLNLKNADIHSLIQTVSRQTSRNFVVDPRVKARVTVISAQPLSSAELYETFLSVLQVHGYAAVPAGDDLIKIVPDVNAKQGPVRSYDGSLASSDELVTQVIKVSNVPAAQLVPILRPLVPQQGHLAAYASTNTLIVTDRASNIARLISIIESVDTPDNEEVEVVRLSFASASEVIRILQSLQQRAGQVAGTPGQVRFAADDRTNSILLSGEQAARARTRALIMNLDTPVESGGNTRVIYLRYANAADLVGILTGVSAGQALIGTGGDDAAEAGQPNAPSVPQVDANGVVVQQAAQTPTASLIRRANEDTGPTVDIQADEDTNALIITAPPDEMRSILAVIEQLDIRRAQVLVEAIIAELSTNNSAQLGVNFAVDGSENNRPIAYTNLGGATQQLVGTVASGGAALANGLSLALGRFGSDSVDFGFLLSAIASDSDNNILSTPTLVTMDNQEAEIVVGQNVPFVTGTQLSSANDNPFQTIERQDIGISLKVRPQINEGNNIRMEIEQEVSDVSNTAVTGATDITTNLRSIRTTVLVEDGQTLVLGGLIDDQVNDSHDKVPLLGDIPLIGSLFRFRTSNQSKRNLMVFLHPTILRDPDSADFYSRAKYDDIRNTQLGLFNGADDLSGTPRPFLPKLELFFDGKPVDATRDALNTIVPTSAVAPATTKRPTGAENGSNRPLIAALPGRDGADVAPSGPFDTFEQ